MTFNNPGSQKVRGLFAGLIGMLLFLSGCADSEGEFTSVVSGAVISQHDYDPISDAVVSWTLRPGDRIGQSFTLAENQTISGLQLKLMRMGEPPPLTLRLRSEWNGDDLIIGEIPPSTVSRFFETWTPLGLPDPLPLEDGGTYTFRLEVADNDDSPGYYELYGTASSEVDHPHFNIRYQYEPNWGDRSEEQETTFENPANLDYGTTTKSYPGGVALDESGAPLEPLDFAFRLFSDSAATQQNNTPSEDRFSFIENELLAPLHPPFSRTPQGEAHNGEIAVTEGWSLVYRSTAAPLVETYVRDFHSYLRSWGVRTDMVPVPVMETQSGTAVLVGTVADFPEHGDSLERSESFVVEITSGEIIVCGFDEKGVIRGLLYLEDLMNLRGGPFLNTGRHERTPRFQPRITSTPFYSKSSLSALEDPYRNQLLLRIAHYGFSAIWLWTDLFDVGKSAVYPELDQDVARNQARLREISERAAGFGLETYVYMASKPLPSSFFESHPHVRGTPLTAYGGEFVLCSSVPEVRRYVREATANLFAEVPGLSGMVFIIGGEGFFHCYTRNMNCPRCSQRPPQEVVAELSAALNEGVREGNPDAQAAMWPYSASNIWSSDDRSQTRLIRLLPKELALQTEFGKEGLITLGNVTIPAYDYPISYLGPSERFQVQAEVTRQRGMPLWVKTEHAIALEFIQTPYIPVFPRWVERFQRIAGFEHVSGVFANWMHYGFMPTIAAELFKWQSWEPAPSGSEILGRLARREFGPGTEEAALQAWDSWSEAIVHYPFAGRMAMGPIQKGPAHPLFLDPSYQPRHHYGRQFKNDLSWTEPWGPELALEQLENLAEGWEKGIEDWQQVLERSSGEGHVKADRMHGIARALMACIRSTVHVARFYQARDRYFTESNPATKNELAEEMMRIAQLELANAESVLPYVEWDSRIGYANSGSFDNTGVARGGIYSPGSIRKKIEQLRRLIDHELPYLIE